MHSEQKRLDHTQSQRLMNLQQLRAMRSKPIKINVHRMGKWQQISSEEVSFPSFPAAQCFQFVLCCPIVLLRSLLIRVLPVPAFSYVVVSQKENEREVAPLSWLSSRCPVSAADFYHT